MNQGSEGGMGRGGMGRVTQYTVSRVRPVEGRSRLEGKSRYSYGWQYRYRLRDCAAPGARRCEGLPCCAERSPSDRCADEAQGPGAGAAEWGGRVVEIGSERCKGGQKGCRGVHKDGKQARYFGVTAPHEKTPDGVPTMVAVNYLGPYVFTRTLLPLLKQTAQEPDSDVRIVNVASTAYSLTPSSVKFGALQDFDQEFRCRPLSGLTRYAHSKLMVIMWTRTLQKQLDADSSAPITAVAIHPGGVDTFTHKWPMSRLWKPIVGLFIAQPETGAYTSVFAAASKKVAANRQLYKGAYLESKPPGHFKELNRMAKNDELARDLAKTTDLFLKDIGV